MALKVKDAVVGVGGPRGLLRLFSSSSFVPKPSAVPQPAEPSTSLFVSGLNKRTTSEQLKEAFSEFGVVEQAKVVTDRAGYSKGFGFVKYATLDDAAKGIEGMYGKFLDGWVIFAEYARPRPAPASSENYGYGNATSCDHSTSSSSTPSY